MLENTVATLDISNPSVEYKNNITFSAPYVDSGGLGKNTIWCRKSKKNLLWFKFDLKLFRNNQVLWRIYVSLGLIFTVTQPLFYENETFYGMVAVDATVENLIHDNKLFNNSQHSYFFIIGEIFSDLLFNVLFSFVNKN